MNKTVYQIKADPEFYPKEVEELEQRCTDPDFISQLLNNITEQTHDIGLLLIKLTQLMTVILSHLERIL